MSDGSSSGQMFVECILFQGGLDSDGYGQKHVNGKTLRTHRLAYEEWFGEIPAGLQIDHLCRNRACRNPFHLEAVTRRENILRGAAPSAMNAIKETCKYGHQGGWYYIRSNARNATHRRCKECQRLEDQRRKSARGVD